MIQTPILDCVANMGVSRNRFHFTAICSPMRASLLTNKGPHNEWLTGYGFESFYGFLAGEASQYRPTLVCNTNQVTDEKPEGDFPDQGIFRRHSSTRGEK